MAASSVSLYLLPPLTHYSISKPKSRISSLKTSNPSLQIASSSISFTSFSSKRIISNPNPPHKNTQIWRISAASEEIVTTTTANTVEKIQELSASEDGSGISTTISILLIIAFIGLTILTIGVVYIAVADFLQKREADKFAKEEAAKKKKKGGKKKVVRAKNGPRGFGQKIVEEDDDFDDEDGGDA